MSGDAPKRTVAVLDTTLRDGLMRGDVTMTRAGRVRFAKALVKLGVDVIEAGYPFAYPADAEALQAIGAEAVGKGQAVLCALAACDGKEIDAAWAALQSAPKKRLHLWIATSPHYLTGSMQRSQQEVTTQAVRAVKHALSLGDVQVQLSAFDATRSDAGFLKDFFAAAIQAGAGKLGVPDSMGHATPVDYHALLRDLLGGTLGSNSVTWSAHCHNDLGLATANALAAIHGGVAQVEVSVTGLGERAGNAPLEEVVMALAVRQDLHPATTAIRTDHLYPTAKLLQDLTGLTLPPFKPVVGDGAIPKVTNAATRQHQVLTRDAVGQPLDL